MLIIHFLPQQYIKPYNEDMISMVINADRSARKTFVGMVFIKIGTGIITLWGAINIYFFSHLRNHGAEITNNTNSLMLLGAMIPSTVSALFSTRLTKAYGYQTVIRICSVIFALSPLMINIVINKFVVALCYLFIPITCFGISSIPVLNCIWSQFPKDLNKISGAAILFFSLGSIIWNIVFTAIINPNNDPAVIDNSQQPYFKQQISNNIFKATNITFLSSGLCFFIGSFLVQKKHNNDIELAEESPPAQDDHKVQNKKENAQYTPEEPKSDTIHQLEGKEKPKNMDALKKCIKDNKFIILCFISYLIPLYLIYLVLFMKILLMPIINDDHFLAWCSVLITLSAIFGGPCWGKVGDRYGFRFTLMLIISIDICCKILGLFCRQKWNLALLYFMLGFNDKGVLTLIGPGLIQMFGLQMATELIPYKGMFLIMSYITVPLTHLILKDLVSYQTILIIFIVGSSIALYLSYYFYRFVKYKSLEMHSSDQKGMVPLDKKIQEGRM